MRYRRSDRFAADYQELDARERELFRQAVRQLNEAYRNRGDRPVPRWPDALRVKSVRDSPGVWEMTWSFSGPDGRATFDYQTIEGELGIRWRRIGGHEIFREP
jgi:hypothetical protein